MEYHKPAMNSVSSVTVFKKAYVGADGLRFPAGFDGDWEGFEGVSLVTASTLSI